MPFTMMKRVAVHTVQRSKTNRVSTEKIDNEKPKEAEADTNVCDSIQAIDNTDEAGDKNETSDANTKSKEDKNNRATGQEPNASGEDSGTEHSTTPTAVGSGKGSGNPHPTSFKQVVWQVLKDRKAFKFDINHDNEDNEAENKNEELEDDEEDEDDDVDFGYFGIATYYVQIAAGITLDFEFDGSSSYADLDRFAGYINQFLNIEVTQFSSMAKCSFKGLTMVKKTMASFILLLVIYISWFLFFFFVKIAMKIWRLKNPSKRKRNIFKTLYLKLIQGLIEIIKYTYSGIAGLTFVCLTCTEIDGDLRWQYDGNITCYTMWQMAAFIFAMFYTIPFCITIGIGIKKMREEQISGWSFIWSCFAPLPFLVWWLFPTGNRN